MMLSVGVVLRAAFLGQGRHRLHYVVFALLSAVPLAAHFAYVHYDWTVFGFDPTPMSFVFVLITFVVLIFAGRMFDLLPVAQHLLLKVLFDPVLVINSRQEVIEANPAALQLADMKQGWQGQRLTDWPVYGQQLTDLLAQSVASATPPLLELQNPPRFFEVHRRLIERSARVGNFVLGQMLYLRDVTQPHLSELRLSQALAVSEERLRTISRLHEQVREQVLHDPLTGLFNRRYLDEFFAREQSRARREDSELVLALIDLDHFKILNDTHGHMVGDEVLRAVADFFETSLRSTDVVFRIGGEEFLLILTGLDVREALARVESLREQFSSSAIMTKAGPLTVRFSAGLANRRVHGEELDELMQAADAALYQAKREGRNRVLLASEKLPL
jgi:diguanylate cyclase (GGDEF)-like protein